MRVLELPAKYVELAAATWSPVRSASMQGVHVVCDNTGHPVFAPWPGHPKTWTWHAGMRTEHSKSARKCARINSKNCTTTTTEHSRIQHILRLPFKTTFKQIFISPPPKRPTEVPKVLKSKGSPKNVLHISFGFGFLQIEVGDHFVFRAAAPNKRFSFVLSCSRTFPIGGFWTPMSQRSLIDTLGGCW